MSNLPAATGLDDATLDAIAGQVRALRDWLSDEGYPRLHLELPRQQRGPDGSETNAILDVLAEGAHGLLILDHKSGACPDPGARFAGYLPQLATYAGIAETSLGKPVRSLAIHWMSEGTVSVAPVAVRVTA